ncbi:MAG TPA: hypothetical protein VKT77_14755 [Chthonomonadaceae bacterium]|nr:hypothetical protein [Chthonomonadaceae bacterium]
MRANVGPDAYPGILAIPEVGDTIYLPTLEDLGRGGEMQGGAAVVASVEEGVSCGEPALYVRAVGFPDACWRWQSLEADQAAWRAAYGGQTARPAGE